MEKFECKLWKLYGHVVRMEGNRWRERQMTWPPRGRRRGGRFEISGKMSGKSDEAELITVWRSNKPENTAKSNRVLVTGGPMEN